jgi:cell division protein FtsL
MLIDTLSSFLPLLQFAVATVIIPLYRTMKNQEEEIHSLKRIIENQQIQIELLEAIVFETASPEIITKHLAERHDFNRNKK